MKSRKNYDYLQAYSLLSWCSQVGVSDYDSVQRFVLGCAMQTNLELEDACALAVYLGFQGYSLDLALKKLDKSIDSFFNALDKLKIEYNQKKKPIDFDNFIKNIGVKA